MTVSATARKVSFDGNDVATEFAFTFTVFSDEDLVVTLTDAAGVDSILTLDSDYSVSLNISPTPGGDVTYPLSGDPLATGEKLTVTSSLELSQTTELTNGGGFFPATIEDRLDYMTVLTQENAEKVGRALLASVSDDSPQLGLGTAAQRASKYLAFDAVGDVQLTTQPGAPLPQSGALTPAEFGALGDGVSDDNAKVQALVTAASVENKPVYWPPGKRYLLDRTTGITVPAGQQWIGTAQFVFSGTVLAYDTPLEIGSDCVIEAIDWTTANGQTGRVMYIGQGTRIGLIHGAVDTGGTQHTSTAIVTDGQDVKIGRVETVGYDRPFQVFNEAATRTTGFYLGFLDVTGYVRALNLIELDDFKIGGYCFRTRSANASVSPGHNGMLLDGVSNGTFGDGRIEYPGEHGVRFAGTADPGPVAENVEMGVVTVVGSGGCAVKLNPGLGLVERVSIDGIVGVDIGEGSTGGNRELLRISHSREVTVGYIVASTMNETTSCRSVIRLNNVIGLSIGHVYARDVFIHAINIDKDTDVAGPGFNPGGDVTDVSIGGFDVETLNGSVVWIGMEGFNVGDIYVRGMALQDSPAVLTTSGTAPTFTGPVYIRGVVNTLTVPVFTTLPDDDDLQGDLLWNGRRFSGRLSSSTRFGSRYEYVGGNFDDANVSFSPDITIYGRDATAGAGNKGTALSFSRLGSGRRGAAIVPVQETSDAYSTGLAVYTGTVTTASDLLRPCATFTWARDLMLDGAGRGIILKSPDGLTTKRIAIDNSGAIVVEDP